MQYSSSVDLEVSRAEVLPYVADLSQYQLWMPLIHGVESIGQGVWKVELRAKVGVFARSKRLTMVRTAQSEDHVVFERQEDDGRQHAPWVMEVSLSQTTKGCTVTIHLSYGGTLWTAGVLDKILAHQVDLGKKSLAQLVTHSL
jgi:carbon monoxide dehydrogenase subunit G